MSATATGVAGRLPARDEPDRAVVTAELDHAASDRPHARTLSLGLHLASLVAAAGILLVANRNQWFFGDEWAFVVNRGPGLGELDLFRPHNDHWSTLPLLIWWALLSTVGLSSYLPYALVVVVAHLALTHLLWRASLRAGAEPLLATALAAIFAVIGAGAENLLWGFQIGFVGAVACGWAAVLIHDHDGVFDRRDLAGWGASIAALMFSSTGIVMLGVATLTVWLRRRQMRDVVLTAAVPFVAFAVWYVLEGRHAPRVANNGTSRWLVVDWMWNGVTFAVESIVGIPGSGAILVLALLFWWARRRDLVPGREALAVAGVVGMFAFYLMTGFGRVALGPESATASRYVYIAAALLLPATAVVLSRVLPATPQATVVVLAVCGLVAVHNVGELRTLASIEMGREQGFKGKVLAAAELLREREPVNPGPLDAKFNPDLRTVDLPRLDSYGWLPDVEPSRRDELTALAAVGVVATAPGGASGSVPISGSAVTLLPLPTTDGTTCLTAQPVPGSGEPQVLVGSDEATWRVGLRGVDSGARLRVSVGDGDHLGRPVDVVVPTDDSDLVAAVDGLTVVVDVPSRGLGFCGVEL